MSKVSVYKVSLNYGTGGIHKVRLPSGYSKLFKGRKALLAYLSGKNWEVVNY